MDTFGVLFWVLGACHCKNIENLGFDDLLLGFATFKGSQGFETEVEMAPETRKERREERKEQRR